MRQTGVVTFNGGFADAQIQALQCYFVKVLREWAAHRQDAVEEQDAASTIGRLVFVTLAWLLSGLSLVLGFLPSLLPSKGTRSRRSGCVGGRRGVRQLLRRVCRLLTSLQKVWLHEPLSFLDRRHGLLSISALRFAAVQRAWMVFPFNTTVMFQMSIWRGLLLCILSWMLGCSFLRRGMLHGLFAFQRSRGMLGL